MAIISTTYLSRVEQLLGAAYAQMRDSMGDLNTPGSVNAKLTEAKATLVGGRYAEMGIAPDPLNAADKSGQVVPLETVPTYYVTVPETRVIFGGTARMVPTTAVLLDDTFNEELAALVSGFSYPVTLSIRDLGLDVTPTVMVAKGSENPTNLYGSPISLLYPAMGRNEVLLANLTVTVADDYSGIATANIDMSNQPVINFAPPSDDDYLKYLFPGFNNTEDRVRVLNRAPDLQDAVTALVTMTSQVTSTEFRKYWRDQDYAFSANFCRLYSDLNGVELPQKMAQTGVAAPTYFDNTLTRPQRLEVKFTAGTPNGTTQVDVYAIKNSYVRVLKDIDAVATNMYVEALPDAWPSNGYCAMYQPYGDTLANVWRVGSYQREAVGLISVPTLAGSSRTWDKVYLVEKQTASFPTTSPLNTVVQLGSTTDTYLGVATATGGTGDQVFVVRNSV